MADTTIVNTQARISFFDDDNLKIKFEWGPLARTPYVNILKQTPMQRDNWTRTLANSQSTVQGYFLLFKRCLIEFKNNTSKQPESVLEIANSKMKVLPNNGTDGVYGFSLSKNGNTYEFTTKNENTMSRWVASLRSICVLSTFHEEYKAIKMIGKGSFAKVYLVESNNDGKSYAVKAFTKEGLVLSNQANAKPSMINEIDIMRATNHENIIQLYEVFETEKSIYLVLELIQGKSMQDVLQKSNFKEVYSEIKCINLIRSLLDALAYLASQNIMHRDLKPENILLEKGEKIKIVDFGLATFINVDEYMFKKCGTPGYIAPEVFKYDPKNPLTFYDDRCDVFSAGCIFYYMLFGCPFFDGSNGSEILTINRKFTVEYESLGRVNQELKNPESKISKEALNLLKKLLQFDQKNRSKAVEALSHSYFTPSPSKSISKTDSSGNLSKMTESGSFSPVLKKNDSDAGKLANNSKKERYEQKDSLYIDVGQPVLNGKTDTMTSGVNSSNNSILLGQGTSNGSNPSSLSKFSGGGMVAKRDSLKVKTGGNNLLKAAIFKNVEKNNPNFEDDSPTRISRQDSKGNGVSAFTGLRDNQDGESDSSNPQKDESKKAANCEKHTLRISTPGKRFSLIEGKGSNSNSPGYGSPMSNSPNLPKKNSKNSEEYKSPY